MKKRFMPFILILQGLTLSMVMTASAQQPVGEVIYVEVREDTISGDDAGMPSFPGDIDGLCSYFEGTIRYPKELSLESANGEVTIDFLISRSGQIVYHNLRSGIHPLADAEAVRAVLSMPLWSPARTNVKVNYSMVLCRIVILFWAPSDQARVNARVGLMCGVKDLDDFVRLSSLKR